MKRMALFYSFVNVFNVWLNRIAGSSYLLLLSKQYCCGWSILKNSGLTQTWVKKGRSTLMIFSDNFGYSFLLLHQTLTRGCLLKFSSSVKSETVSVDFLYVVTLKYIGHLVLWMALSPINDLITQWDELSGKYWLTLHYSQLSNIDIFHYAVLYEIILVITSDLIRIVFKNLEAVKLIMMNISFPKFWFSIESSNIIIGSKYCQLFYLKLQAHIIYL